MNLRPLLVAVIVGAGCSPIFLGGTEQDGGTGTGGGAGGGTAGGSGGGTAGGMGGGTAGGMGGGTAGGSGGGTGGGSAPDAGRDGGNGGSGGAGGAGGAGGGKGDAGTTCDELRDSYQKLFPDTRECNPASLVNECTAARERVLGCGCKSFVNSNGVTSLDAVAAQWKGQNCPPPPCPAVVCPEAKGGSCEQQDASFTGVCHDTF